MPHGSTAVEAGAGERTASPGAAPAAHGRLRAPRGAPGTSRTWTGFTRALADTLTFLEDGNCLILEHRGRPGYVQVAAEGPRGMRLEAVSNHYLAGRERLGRGKQRLLRRLGWLTPTHAPDAPRRRRRESEGSPNFYLDLDAPVPFAAAAALLVATLREVYEVPYPGCLAYKAFDLEGPAILLPTLRINRIPPAGNEREAPRRYRPHDKSQLETAVTGALRRHTGDPSLDFGDEGCLVLSRRAVTVFVRVGEEEPLVSLIATTAGCSATPAELLAEVNELNGGEQFAAFSLFGNNVMAAVTVDAGVFVAETLTRALDRFGDAVEAARGTLKEKLGDRIDFSDDPVEMSDSTTTKAN